MSTAPTNAPSHEPVAASRPASRLALPIGIVLATSVASGAAAYVSGGFAVSAVVATITLVGGAVVALVRRGSGGSDVRARHLLAIAVGEAAPSATGRAPRGFQGTWAALYQEVAALYGRSRADAEAVHELEKLRRQIERAVAHVRSGADPLVEDAELRAGPLRELLEAAQQAAVHPPIISRMPITEQELVGGDGDTVEERPAPRTSREPGIAAEDLSAMIDELTSLQRALADVPADSNGARNGASAGSVGPGSAAALVDTVVHTAANGIEDVAAGLMRANELAGIAERVTNRATLLALNAALEATRSGSEAFTAIAEETRRLAEYAREATDTISRLASEIEYKVGETITAIHATSDHAKSVLASWNGSHGSTSPDRAVARAAVDSLLARARSLERQVGSAADAAL